MPCHANAAHKKPFGTHSSSTRLVLFRTCAQLPSHLKRIACTSDFSCSHCGQPVCASVCQYFQAARIRSRVLWQGLPMWPTSTIVCISAFLQ
eukprot:5413206-Amphidinium_carterae.2